MALLVRLRRATALSMAILKDRSFCSISSTSYPHFPLLKPRSPAASPGNRSVRTLSLIQSSSFHSSIPCSIRWFDRDQENKIPEDEILFDGCDCYHWLITMEFPKDPKPSPEEMVETYVQTLAKVVGSVEEAKKRMYACSTTTYTGFQAIMTEEMSDKFTDLPGVEFVLPDSYVDPVNKAYGGDKYDNGVITPMPPPFQFRGQSRFDDENGIPWYFQKKSPTPMQGRDQPLQNEYQQMPRGNPPNDHKGPKQDYGSNYASQQNYGPPGQEGRSYSPPGNTQQGNPQMQPGNQTPYFHQGFVQDGGNYSRQQNYGPTGHEGRDYES